MVSQKAKCESIEDKHGSSLGGVTLLRAAAKNHARVSIVSDPKDYAKVIEELKQGQVTQETRNSLALKVFY